jgi:hypothetical protein
MRIAVAAVLLGGAVAAAILLNLALLGYAQPRNDPVGKLSPRMIMQPGQPVVTTVPVETEHENDD